MCASNHPVKRDAGFPYQVPMDRQSSLKESHQGEWAENGPPRRVFKDNVY